MQPRRKSIQFLSQAFSFNSDLCLNTTRSYQDFCHLPPGQKGMGPSEDARSTLEAGAMGKTHPLPEMLLEADSEETRSCYVAQVGLELLRSSNVPASASQSAEISGLSHRTQPSIAFPWTTGILRSEIHLWDCRKRTEKPLAYISPRSIPNLDEKSSPMIQLINCKNRAAILRRPTDPLKEVDCSYRTLETPQILWEVESLGKFSSPTRPLPENRLGAVAGDSVGVMTLALWFAWELDEVCDCRLCLTSLITHMTQQRQP
ncbi:hypothetical protein AAY473_036376 [Plecturocebus cupreus]